MSGRPRRRWRRLRNAALGGVALLIMTPVMLAMLAVDIVLLVGYAVGVPLIAVAVVIAGLLTPPVRR